MSAPTLPAEILDLIFDLIQPKSSLPIRQSLQSPPILADPDTKSPMIASSQQSLASLALISKQFLSPARIHLYSRPILRASSFTCETATTLLDTLNTNNRYLGRLVKSVEGICSCMVNLIALLSPSKPGISQLDESTKALIWYWAALRACPRLVEVEIYGRSSQEIKTIESILETATWSLRIVNFVDIPGFLLWRTELNMALVTSALGAPAFQFVETVSIDDVSTYSQRHQTLSPASVDHPIHTLRLKSTYLRYMKVSALQIIDLSQFHTLALLSETSTYRGLPALLASLAPALCKLVYSPPIPFTNCCVPQTRYARLFEFGIDLESLRTLANLTSIRILHARGAFLTTLRTLSSSSLRLKSIDLHGSNWIQTDGETLLPEPRRLTYQGRYITASKSELEPVLQSLASLRFIDLGILPTIEPGEYVGLGGELKRRGVTVVWDYCREDEPCPICGDAHV